MKFYGVLDYTTKNIGDWVQTIATAQFLPSIDFLYERDSAKLELLSTDLQQCVDPEKYLIYNAWITDFVGFGESGNVENILFTSLHIGDYFKRLNGKYDPINGTCIGFDKQFSQLRNLVSEIGARDSYSKDKLSAAGFSSYLSYCNTLSLNGDSYTQDQREGIYFVDVRSHDIVTKFPASIYKGRINTYHELEEYRSMSFTEKIIAATDLLHKYNKAKLVVTTRLHAALPCLAFGTPVIYIANTQDPRLVNTYNPLFSHLIDKNNIDVIKKIDFEYLMSQSSRSPLLLDIREKQSLRFFLSFIIMLKLNMYKVPLCQNFMIA